jgi:hypothetical protein
MMFNVLQTIRNTKWKQRKTFFLQLTYLDLRLHLRKLLTWCQHAYFPPEARFLTILGCMHLCRPVTRHPSTRPGRKPHDNNTANILTTPKIWSWVPERFNAKTDCQLQRNSDSAPAYVICGKYCSTIFLPAAKSLQPCFSQSLRSFWKRWER